MHGIVSLWAICWLISIEPCLCIWDAIRASNEVSPPPILRRRSSTDATGQVISFGNNEISWDQTSVSVNVTPVNVTPRSFSEIFTGPQQVTPLPTLVLVKQPERDVEYDSSDDDDEEEELFSAEEEEEEDSDEPFDASEDYYSIEEDSTTTTTSLPIIVLSREKLLRNEKNEALMFVTPSTRASTTAPPLTTRPTVAAKSITQAAISSSGNNGGVPASGDLPRSWTAANYDPRKFQHQISSIRDNDDHYLGSSISSTTTEKPAFVTPLPSSRPSSSTTASRSSSTTTYKSTTSKTPSSTSKSIIEQLRQDYRRRGGGRGLSKSKKTKHLEEKQKPQQQQMLLLQGPTPLPKPTTVVTSSTTLFKKGPSLRFVDDHKSSSDNAEERSYVPLSSNQYQIVHSPGVTTIYQETTKPSYGSPIFNDVNDFASDDAAYPSTPISYDGQPSTTSTYAPPTEAPTISYLPPREPTQYPPTMSHSYLPPNNDFSTPLPSSLTPPVGPTTGRPPTNSNNNPTTVRATTQTSIVTTTYDAIVPNNELSYNHYDDVSFEDSSPASDIYHAGPVVIIMPNQANEPPTQQDESTPKTNIKGMSGQVVPILLPPKESNNVNGQGSGKNDGSAIEFPDNDDDAVMNVAETTSESLMAAYNSAEDDAYLSPSNAPQTTLTTKYYAGPNPFTPPRGKTTTTSLLLNAPATTGASSDLPRPSAAVTTMYSSTTDNGLRSPADPTLDDTRINDEITKFITDGSGEMEVNFSENKQVPGGKNATNVNQSINLKINVIVQNGSGEESNGSEVELIDSLPISTPASYYPQQPSSFKKTKPFNRAPDEQQPIWDNQPSLTASSAGSPEANKHGRLVDSSEYISSSTFRGQKQKVQQTTAPSPATPNDFLYDSELGDYYYLDLDYESPQISMENFEDEDYAKSIELTDDELFEMYDDLYEVLGELETTLRTPSAVYSTTPTPPVRNLRKKIPRPSGENSMSSVVKPFTDKDFSSSTAFEKKRGFKGGSSHKAPPDHKHLLREPLYPSNIVYPTPGLLPSVVPGILNAGDLPAEPVLYKTRDLRQRFMQYYYRHLKPSDKEHQPKSFYNFTEDLIPDLQKVAKGPGWDVTDFSSWEKMFPERWDGETFENGKPLRTLVKKSGEGRRKTLPIQVTFDNLLKTNPPPQKRMRFSRLINHDVDRIDVDARGRDYEDDDVYELVTTLAKRQGEYDAGHGNYQRMPRDYSEDARQKKSPPTFDISFEDWLHKRRAIDFPARVGSQDSSSTWKSNFRSRRKRLLEIDEPGESPSSLQRETLWEKLVESATNLQQRSKLASAAATASGSQGQTLEESRSKNKYYNSLLEVIGHFANAALLLG